MTSLKLTLFSISLGLACACGDASATPASGPNITPHGLGGSPGVTAGAQAAPRPGEASVGSPAAAAGPSVQARAGSQTAASSMPAAAGASAGAAATMGGAAGMQPGAPSTAGAMSQAGTGGSSTDASGESASAGSSGDAGNEPRQWLGTWTASPYPAASNAQPPRALSQAVLRQVAHVSVGGDQIRLLLSNLNGESPVAIKSVHVAMCRASPAVDSSIDMATDHAVEFSAQSSLSITAGKEVWSDPIPLAVPPLGNVSITIAFGNVPRMLTSHAGSRTTSYVQPASSDVSASSMTSAQTTDHWYFIAGIDVTAPATAKAVAVMGDSITDGRGTDTNMNNRWTDVLAARLQADATTANVAVLNQGIGATNLVGSGTAAQARFERDILQQSGVKYAIVFDGVNDIGGGASARAMQAVYKQLIDAAHAHDVLIYGATILPFAGNGYYSTAHESVRQEVNTYIRSGAFDGYIDFDEVLSDGATPPALQVMYAQWAQRDGLHPGPAGYQKMGEAVDLSLFSR